MIYTALVTLHLVSGTLFIGTLFFWTVMIDPAFRNEGKKIIDPDSLDKAETLLSRYTRRFMRWNVGIIALSGLGMLHYHAPALVSPESSFSILLLAKVLLGSALILLFYAMPYIMRSVTSPQKREILHDRLHIGMLVAMILLMVLAKWMWVA